MRLPNVYAFEDARRIVNEIRKGILDWGMLSVVDVYDLIQRDNPTLDLPLLTYNENTIGWDSYDISSIVIVDLFCGSMIDLPEPHALDRWL